MNRRLLVVSQYFYPENFRINDLCIEWEKAGYSITVLTGIPNYPEGRFFKGYSFWKKRKETWNNINIIRIPIFSRGRNRVSLVINYISFVISGLFWAKFTKNKFDLVLNYEVSPMLQVLPGIWYAKRRSVPVITYVTDLWPENVQIVGKIKNRRVINVIEKIVLYIYKFSTRILVSSCGFIEAISARGVDINKIKYIPYYSENEIPDIPDIQTRKYLHDISKVHITYTGNIGYAQGLDVLVEVASLFKIYSVEKILFVLVGNGRYKDKLIEEIKTRHIDEYFMFIPKLESKEIPKILSESDAAFISLISSNQLSLTLPSKMQTYLNGGMPIIASAEGEIRKIIEEAECGFCSPSGDFNDLYKNLISFLNASKESRHMMGINSYKYYMNHFSKSKVLEDFRNEFTTILGDN